jgi:hypothetical protein
MTGFEVYRMVLKTCPAAAILLIVVSASASVGTHATRADDQRDARLEKESEAVRKEIQDVEIKLERLRGFIPSTLDGEFETYVRQRAQSAGLKSVEVRALPGRGAVPLPDGEASPLVLHRWEVSGRDRDDRVHLLLALLARTRASRVVDFETLELVADAPDEVRFRARLAAVEWAPAGEVAPVTVAPAARSIGDVRASMLQEEREVLARKRGVLTTLMGLFERYEPAHLVDALGAFERDSAGEPVALTRVRFDGDTVLEGVVLGAGARAGLKTALDSAGFQAVVDFSPAGECQAFSATAHLKAGERLHAAPVGNGLFDERTSSICRPEAPPLRPRLAAAGAATSPGGITLQLREAEVADVFRALHDLTKENFVIAPGVDGRVTVDLDGATLEETLAAMRAAGIAVGGGRVRRVSPVADRATAADNPASFDGEPVTILLRNADLREVSCLFKDMTGLEVLAPMEVQGRVSVFTKDVPWDGVFGTILAAAGLVYTIDGTSVFVEPSGAGLPDRAAARNACDGGFRRSWWSQFRSVEQLEPQELHLAGVARAGTTWKAYAYGPANSFWTLEEGQRLFSGRVRSVSANGAVFESARGAPTEAALPR